MMLLLAGSADAGVVIQGVTATATSWWGMPAVSRYQHPSTLVSDYALSAPNDINATHEANADAYDQWHAIAWNNDPNPVVTFDLNGAHNLEAIHIWNGNQGRLGQDNTGRGVKSFTVSVSSDGTNFTEAFTAELIRSPFVNNNVGPVSAQQFSLAGQPAVTKVKIRVNSIHDPANPYPCLSQVMFTEVENFEPVAIRGIVHTGSQVKLVMPSTPGQKFNIFRSTDLAAGFATPFATNVPAAVASVKQQGVIDTFAGETVSDAEVNFSTLLTSGQPYEFVPLNGVNAGQGFAVISWSGSSLTVGQDLSADLTWNGDYQVRTPAPTETEWIDSTPPAGKAFYRAERK